MSPPPDLTVLLERARELIQDMCQLASAITLTCSEPPTVEKAQQLEALAEMLDRTAEELVRASRSPH
jgi:hypothetical protein